MRDISLPSLGKKHMEQLILKQIEGKEAKKYLNFKKKIDN